MNMDKTIFELRFFRKMLLAPTRNDRIDLHSSFIFTGLFGMDFSDFRTKIHRLRYSERRTKSMLLRECRDDVKKSLLPQYHGEDPYKNITSDQLSVLMGMMNFLLFQQQSYQNDLNSGYVCIQLALHVMLVLSASNKRDACKERT